MKKLLGSLVILLMLPLLFVGCTRVNPGPVTTKNYDMQDFSRVTVSSAFEVEIVESSTWSISVTAQEKLFDNINVSNDGDKLEINMKWGWGTWLSNWNYQRPKAKITMPVLAGLDLSGASKGTITGFKSDQDTVILVSGASSLTVNMEAGNTSLEISGASRIEGTIKVADLKAAVTGASRAILSGSANDIDLECSGASTSDLEALTAQNINVDLSGASRATVSPKDTMKVAISGASSLTYTGEPALEAIEVSGASTIHKK
jgi:hypothetical protein